MKTQILTISLFLSFLLFISHDKSNAQIPRTISFQGVLADAQGNLIEGNHQLTFKLYDVAANGIALYTETQTVPVVKGIFNVIIGSNTPLPQSLTFDRAYFLGVRVDNGIELIPRTALTAVPYALRAERANVAEALAPNVAVVTKVNNQSGDISLIGGGSTTITNSGNQITISSTGGTGSGIAGVQNTDGTISIQNPNGPVATIGVANNSINAAKLSDGAVTSTKIASGQVVTSINNLKDAVTLNAGSNISIAPSGNSLTISSTGGSGVPSVNSITGPVTIAASGGATVNTAGNTITINAGAGGGGTGIQGVQNTNNTLDILNPNGPTATINVKNGGITSTQLADNAVTSNKIGDGQVQTNDLADGSVTQTKIASGVTLPPSGTAGGDLTGTYPNPNISNNAVTSAKIADGTIVTADIAAGVIPGSLPPSGNAGGDLTGSYPNPTVANGAITTAKISNTSVTAEKISGTGATNGQVLKFNGSAVVWNVDELGGLTLPYNGNASSTTSVFYVQNLGTGDAIMGYGGTSGSGIVGSLGTGSTFGGPDAGVFGMGPGNEYGVVGTSYSGTAVYGNTFSGIGVKGNNAGSGEGVYGISSSGKGVYGTSSSGKGVSGRSTSDEGVRGEHGTSNNYGYLGSSIFGVYGFHNATSNQGYLGGNSYGVYGRHNSSGNFGYLGSSSYGAYAEHNSSDVYGFLASSNYGAYGRDNTSGNFGYLGSSSNAVRGYKNGGGDYAGNFSGNVTVTGTLSKGGGSFKIDHPLDPANKYLYHSFVESPDMKNIYDGVVTLDANGEAVVQLPEWFETLNKDFRYQLTSIGAPGPNLYIAHAVSANSFQIAGGTAGTKVSWQVTGIRHDPFAEKHRIPVEEMKTGKEAGKYLYPKEHGVSEMLGMDYEELMQIQAEMKKNKERETIRRGERTEEKNK